MESVSCKQFSNEFLRQALFYRFELRVIPLTVCRPFFRRALTNPFALVVHVSPQFFRKILHVPSGSKVFFAGHLLCCQSPSTPDGSFRITLRIPKAAMPDAAKST